jgi:hypothetical protein
MTTTILVIVVVVVIHCCFSIIFCVWIDHMVVVNIEQSYNFMKGEMMIEVTNTCLFSLFLFLSIHQQTRSCLAIGQAPNSEWPMLLRWLKELYAHDHSDWSQDRKMHMNQCPLKMGHRNFRGSWAELL